MSHESDIERQAEERRKRLKSEVAGLAGLLAQGQTEEARQLLADLRKSEPGLLQGFTDAELTEDPALFGGILYSLTRALQEVGGLPEQKAAKRLLGADITPRTERAAFLEGLALPEEFGLGRLEDVEHYRERLRARTAVLAELERDFPGRDFTVLSSEGASSFVCARADEPSAVYKIFTPEMYDAAGHAVYDRGRTEKTVTYADREAGNLALLGEGDNPVTVRLLEYRRPVAVKAAAKSAAALGDRLAETESPLPLIKMERVDFVPAGLKALPQPEREAAAERIAARLVRDDLFPGDVEFVLDRRSGRVVAIDAGGFLHIAEDEEERREAKRREIPAEVRGHLRL